VIERLKRFIPNFKEMSIPGVIITECVMLITVGILFFKSFKTFIDSFVSFLLGPYYAFSDKLWEFHFKRSTRFFFFLMVICLLTLIFLKFLW